MTGVHFILFFQYFKSLSASVSVFSVTMSSGSLILYLVSEMLLYLFSEFFILNIVFLVLEIPFDPF